MSVKYITIRQPDRHFGHIFPGGSTDDARKWYTVPYPTYLSLIAEGRNVEVQPDEVNEKTADILARGNPPTIRKDIQRRTPGQTDATQ